MTMSFGTEGARLGALEMMCYSRHLCIPNTQCCQPRSWTCHVVNCVTITRITIEQSQYSSIGHCRKIGRSRVPFPIVSLEFFSDIILPVALWHWGRLSL